MLSKKLRQIPWLPIGTFNHDQIIDCIIIESNFYFQASVEVSIVSGSLVTFHYLQYKCVVAKLGSKAWNQT